MERPWSNRHVLIGSLLWPLTGAGILGTVFIAGCGDSKTSGTAAVTASNQGKTDGNAADLPTAAIGGPATGARATADASPGTSDTPHDAESQLPKQGSPEWLLGQMMVLFGEPIPAGATPQAQADRLRDRNQKLIEMAHEIIRKTHKDKAQEAIFNKAVQFLTEARFQLATNGSQEDTKALYDDAQALYHRDPASAAAADAAFAVAGLAHTNAQLSPMRNEPRFIQEFAIQARLFATRFPKDGRAVQLLSAAGQSAELYHMDSEAVSCFSLLRENFAREPPGDSGDCRSAPPGTQGKVLDWEARPSRADFVNIEQFRGKPALIVFWASDSEPFQTLLPGLQQVLRQLRKISTDGDRRLSR